jgi:hypothetical protein
MRMAFWCSSPSQCDTRRSFCCCITAICAQHARAHIENGRTTCHKVLIPG